MTEPKTPTLEQALDALTDDIRAAITQVASKCASLSHFMAGGHASVQLVALHLAAHIVAHARGVPPEDRTLAAEIANYLAETTLITELLPGTAVPSKGGIA